MFKHIQLAAFALCALLVIPAAAQVPNYVPTDGLVGWWPFNGNANDESGNGNDGVVNGATLTEDRCGLTNSAYTFDGLDDFINTSFTGILGSGDRTVSYWAKQAQNDSGVIGQVVLGWGGNQCGPSGIATGFYCAYNTSLMGITFESNESSITVASNIPIDDNAWHHYAFVKNSNAVSTSQVLIYQDGVLLNTLLGEYLSWGTLNTTSTVPVTFGKRSFSCVADRFYNGSSDDIAIYNRALTESEIQSLYTSQCPSVSTPCTSLPTNLQQGLVGYWPFCSNANDESGNGNDGLVNGATLTEDRFGNANAAFAFDGVDDFIQASVSELPLSNSERTLSIWVNYNSIPNPGEGYYILSYGSYIPFSFEGNSMGISNNTPIITWRYSGYGTQGTYIDTQTEIDLNTWYNLTGVIENGVVKLYVNGVLISEADASGWNTVLTDLFIGRLVSEDDFTHGSLDDIGIWNRALTAEEVQELYTLDACTFTVYDTLTVYETVYDTVYTYETIYDTVTTYVTVTDTLLIDITFTGFEGQPSWLNTVTVFPNPASDHITIDYGNFALMAGYNTIITDAAGATVYSSAVNSQQVEIDINAWGATGVYYMSVYDASGELVAVRHIVLE
jgi:hypothetical protein